MTSPYKESRKRAENQSIKILKMLTEAGTSGVINSTLMKVSLRYQSVIGSLTREGHDIRVEHLGDGLCKYYYTPKEIIKPKYEGTAKEELFKAIEAKGGEVTADELVQLLDNLSMTLAKKIRKRVG